MSSFTNALANAQHTARIQRWMIFALLAANIVVGLGWSRTQRDMTAHIPPDLTNGAAIRLGRDPEVPAANVYAFAFYMWQQVNRWASDGSKDYGEQIFAMQSFLTPACREQLIEDMRIKGREAELTQRTRALMEIPGYGFSPARITDHGNGSWTVLLDAQLLETSRGMAVKDTYIRYPLHVVRYDVDRERNPWGLALNCYANRRPERIDPSSIRIETAADPAPTLPLAAAAPNPASTTRPTAAPAAILPTE